MCVSKSVHFYKTDCSLKVYRLTYAYFNVCAYNSDNHVLFIETAISIVEVSCWREIFFIIMQRNSCVLVPCFMSFCELCHPSIYPFMFCYVFITTIWLFLFLVLNWLSTCFNWMIILLMNTRHQNYWWSAFGAKILQIGVI